jgi:hypothetical protein
MNRLMILLAMLRKKMMVITMVMTFVLLASSDLFAEDLTERLEEMEAAFQKEKLKGDSRVTSACAYAEVYIKQQLKAPAAARFDKESMLKYIEKLGSNKFRIKSYVDSQNSFGALTRTRFEITVEDTGSGQWKNWKVIDLKWEDSENQEKTRTQEYLRNVDRKAERKRELQRKIDSLYEELQIVEKKLNDITWRAGPWGIKDSERSEYSSLTRRKEGIEKMIRQYEEKIDDINRTF